MFEGKNPVVVFSCGLCQCYAFFVCCCGLLLKFFDLILHLSDAVFCESYFFAHDVNFNLEVVIFADSIVKSHLFILQLVM
jgi:hypothetical protein